MLLFAVICNRMVMFARLQDTRFFQWAYKKYQAPLFNLHDCIT